MGAFNKLVCMVVVSMVVATPLTQGAVTCGQVASSVSPCMGYLRSGGAIPPACCGGIKSLNEAAATTPDRQQTCKCLKSIAGSVSGINHDLAGGLPGKCGVSVPFKISLSTDCNSVK